MQTAPDPALIEQVIGRASQLHQEAELAGIGAEVGIPREYVAAALCELREQGMAAASRPSRIRAWGAAALHGAGVAGLVLWTYFRGAPADFLAMVAALSLVWAGARMLRPPSRGDAADMPGWRSTGVKADFHKGRRP